MNNTGENEQGLRRILELTRTASLVILGLHVYYYCYEAFWQWELTSGITDRLLRNISDTGLFRYPYYSKCLSLGLLWISLLGAKGRKDEKVHFRGIAIGLIAGLALYLLSAWLLNLAALPGTVALLY